MKFKTLFTPILALQGLTSKSGAGRKGASVNKDKNTETYCCQVLHPLFLCLCVFLFKKAVGGRESKKDRRKQDEEDEDANL